MKIITANSFYKAWLNIIKKNIVDVYSCWNSRKDYTNLIIKKDDSLITQVSKELDLICYNADFYSIDSVLYRKEDWLSGYGGVFLRHLVVAFEHENDFFSGLFQETTHLLITQADLKVLVSYPPQELDEFKNKHIKDELNNLYQIILGSPYANEISEKENFLLILGKDDY